MEDLKEGNILLSGGGLSQSAVLKYLQQEGINELPINKPKKLRTFIFDILKEPMVYLIFGCGFIYLLIGDQKEAIMLLLFLFLIIIITIIQEAKAEKSLAALKSLSSPRAQILRDGKKTRVPGKEVVFHDIIFLTEGDCVPADAILISESNLTINESLLSGEPIPVEKHIGQIIFSGTTITRGTGIAMVTAVGISTQIGKIGKLISSANRAPTALEKETNKLVKRLAWIAFILSIIVFSVYSLYQNNLIAGLLIGLTLAMAILPNELPAILTIFFAMAAWRLSKRNVLTRKISAIENLGATTVLCVDKTGTLTLNQMAIERIYSDGKFIDLSNSNLEILPEEFHETLEYGILASRKGPLDPMEIAFSTAGNKLLNGTEHLHHDWKLEKEYPLSPSLLSITHAWKPKSEGEFVIGAKGAPEAIIDLCHMSDNESSQTKKAADEMARLGLRIIGVAKSHFKNLSLPTKQHDFEFSFLGLIGIADPIRSGVPDSITECHNAGIRVVMLTGDHPITASVIAKKIGLKNPENIVSGNQLEEMSNDEISKLTKTVSVFSRVMPSQKLLLVNALKNSGEVVAMTGDGVNDAPALKSANIGIAMGARGTDVARESADIVLLDDDFSSIVEAIRTGRKVYVNIKNTLTYLFAIHIPIAGISILPVILNSPLILLPAHIALLHIIIEPAFSLAFEMESNAKDVMVNKPRSPNEPLYNRNVWYPSLIRGIILLLALICVYFISLWSNKGETETRTLVFTTLILSNAFLIYLIRPIKISALKKIKFEPNKFVSWLMAGSIVTLGLSIYIPILQKLFGFSYLHPIDIFICLIISIMTTILSEIVLIKIF